MDQMSRRRIPLLCLVTMAFAGCAESTLIKTAPPSAQVWINDKYVGISPVEYIVPRSQWPDSNRFHYRLTREGYLTKEGEFNGFVGGGRVTGGVFSLGISLIFKRPTTLDGEYQFELDPIARTTSDSAAVSGASRAIDMRLRQVDELYERGAINEQEHLRKRREILDSM